MQGRQAKLRACYGSACHMLCYAIERRCTSKIDEDPSPLSKSADCRRRTVRVSALMLGFASCASLSTTAIATEGQVSTQRCTQDDRH